MEIIVGGAILVLLIRTLGSSGGFHDQPCRHCEQWVRLKKISGTKTWVHYDGRERAQTTRPVALDYVNHPDFPLHYARPSVDPYLS